MSDNKLVKTIMDAATITGIAAGIGWIGKKSRERKLHQRPKQQCHELCQIHRRHGCQPLAETISRGPEDSS